MSNDTRDNIPMDDNKFYNGHGGANIGEWLAWRNSKIDAANAANVKKSDAEFQQKLQNGGYNTPYDAKNLNELADFINANKNNYYFNVQPMIQIPNNWHPEARDMQTTIYLDVIAYAKLMRLIGNHNPYDDYVGHK